EGMPPPAVVLANGMLRATGMTHLRIAAALLLMVSVVGSATAFLIQRAALDPHSPLAAGGDSTSRTTAALQEESDPECKEHPRLHAGGTLIASPKAFATLVKPECSHCREEARRRAGELRDEDRALCWIRGDFNGGVIPL